MGLYRLLLRLSLSFKTGSWELSNILDESTLSTLYIFFVFFNPSTSLFLSLPPVLTPQPHPPSLAVPLALSPYNLSLPDCSIISPLWMADGRSRWAYRGQARAVVGVEHVYILFLLNSPSLLWLSSFFSFAAVCIFESCCLKISERWRDLWSLESAWSSHGCFQAAHLAFCLRGGANTELFSLQPYSFLKMSMAV